MRKNLRISKKSSTFAADLVVARMVRTVYDSIRAQKQNGTWGDNLVLFARCETLEYYYRIYKAVLVEREKKQYGYIQRVCNSLKISKLGGGYLAIDKYMVQEAIEEMEEPVFDTDMLRSLNEL